jgi:hypothetical protein
MAKVKKVATLPIAFHGQKDSVYEGLNDSAKAGNITQELVNKLIEDLPGRRYPIQYVNYEVIMYVDVFDDATFKISHFKCDGDIWIRGTDKDIQI